MEADVAATATLRRRRVGTTPPVRKAKGRESTPAPRAAEHRLMVAEGSVPRGPPLMFSWPFTTSAGVEKGSGEDTEKTGSLFSVRPSSASAAMAPERSPSDSDREGMVVVDDVIVVSPFIAISELPWKESMCKLMEGYGAGDSKGDCDEDDDVSSDNDR